MLFFNVINVIITRTLFNKNIIVIFKNNVN